MLNNIKNIKITDIEFDLGDYCNAACPLCARNHKNTQINTSFRSSIKIINQLDNLLKTNKIEWIRLVGSVSEPTLHPDFLFIINEIKKRNINIEICTNGDTQTRVFWEELKKLLTDRDKVYFTICGSTQELHETYRKNTKLKNILQNIKYFQSENKNDYAQCIQFKYNKNDLNSENFQKMISFISNIYMTKTYLYLDKDKYKNITDEDLEKLAPISNEYYKINNIVKKFRLNKKIILCKAKENNSIFISKNGDIFPCYLFYEQNKDQPNIENWDYNKIKNFDYYSCKFCEKNIRNILKKKDMEYII